MLPLLLLVASLVPAAVALPPVARPATQPALVPGQPRHGLRPLAAEAPAAWADCGSCHGEIQAAWASSRHAAAATAPAFQVSWAAFPDGWCLHCHAPTAAAQEALLGGFTAVPGVAYEGRVLDGVAGVDCAVCHLRETAAGAAVATATRPAAAAESAHPVVVEADLGSAVCADCHDFPLQQHSPRLPLVLGETPAQSTVTEWAAWRGDGGGGEEDCAACHLDGHRFPGRELLDVDVEVTVLGDRARVVLTHDAGHAVPTGDPFRALELTLCRDLACEEPAGALTLGRTLAVTASSWEEVADTRIPASGRGVYTVALRATPRAWQLDYRLVDPAHVAHLPAEDARLPVARGVLSSPPAPETP